MPRIKIDTDSSVVPETEQVETVAEPEEKEKPKSGGSLLAAFSSPLGVTFEGKDADEEIILLLRAHVVTNIAWVMVTIGLLVAPLVLAPLVAGVGVLPISGGTGLGVILLWYLGTFTYAFINFLSWYFNVYILTNKRVVDIDWYSVIYHAVSSCPISKIQDVTLLRLGVFSGVFGYGDVHIQTAGEEANFDFLAVPHPELVKDELERLMEGTEKERSQP